MNSDETTPKQRTVKCPQCGRPALYSLENKYRPFCSERCRVIDLGHWADESYKVPTESSSEVEESDLPDEDAEN